MLIYKSRAFDIYSTNVSSRRAPLEYVGHRGTCAALIVDPRDEIGLAAHHRPAVGRTLFELPSGLVEEGLSEDELMRRELKTEAGLSLGSGQLRRLTTLFSAPGYSSESVILFYARISQSQRAASDNLRWFTLPELNRHIHEQELIDLKTVAAITAYQAILWKGSGDEVI